MKGVTRQDNNNTTNTQELETTTRRLKIKHLQLKVIESYVIIDCNTERFFVAH